MRIKRFDVRVALAAFALAAAGHAGAVVTYAEARANASGLDPIVQIDTEGAGGAVASVNQIVPGALGDVFVTAQAVARPGTLGVAGVARSEVPTDAQVRTQAVYTDEFSFGSPGFGSTQTGIFSFAVGVSGGLVADITGAAIVDTSVTGYLYLDAGNGNVGRVQDTARRIHSFEVGYIPSGSESFLLHFDDVPFTFGKEIVIEMRLQTVSGINVFNGGSAYAGANYGHTMSWLGLTNVRDASGNLLQDYSAVSPTSGFNFAQSVPEPNTAALLLAGLLVFTGIARPRVAALKRR